MKKINFRFEKNQEIIIKKENINCIINNNVLSFIVEGIKYKYDNNIFTRETEEEIITINLKDEICRIKLKKENLDLNLNIKCLENKKIGNIITIKYKIETEEDILNIITIEYV